MFPTETQEIHHRIQQIDPVQYARSRNFSDGAVTHLSPYISRGVISTKQVFDHWTFRPPTQNKGHDGELYLHTLFVHYFRLSTLRFSFKANLKQSMTVKKVDTPRIFHPHL